jgi:hypothetical protein
MTALLLLLAAFQSSADTHVLLVTGVGGEPRFSTAFEKQGADLLQALTGQYGIPRSQVMWLAERQPEGRSLISGRSTSEAVRAAMTALATSAKPDDQVLIVYIGHGSDADEPKINLPGPDLTASDLRALLSGFTTQRVAVVFAASASGGMIDALSGPNRLIMTATKTGLERNETVFATAFVAGMSGSAADTDKDGRLSLAEAFSYTVAEVARVYTSDNRLQTEHARVSDSTLARRFILVPASVAAAQPTDSVSVALLARKAELERQIEALRARRDAMPAAEYETALEALILDLARVNQQLRARAGQAP